MFVRSNATLALVLTNDAADLSNRTTTADQMIKFLKSIKGGDLSRVVVYGVFGATDLDCDTQNMDGDWNYSGSEFEKLINATGGKVFSLCDGTFGDSLSKIADDLGHRLENPRIMLNQIPIVSSIHVLYHGADLPGGSQASGGIWYYDETANAITFYNLNFAPSDTEEVTVQFVEDTGSK